MSNDNQPETDRHLSKEELKELARAMVHGDVFTSVHLVDQGAEALARHFMPLAFADRETMRTVLSVVDPEGHHLEDDHDPSHADLDPEREVGMIYEYMDKAAPMAVNGLPVFYSLKLLSPREATIVHDTVVKLIKAEEEALDGDGD